MGDCATANMAFYSYNKFRLLVFVLLVLITWQIFRLLPSTNLERSISSDSIELLEDSKYNKHKVDRVRVRVYYEALCPDSRYFFVHHLKPVSDQLADFLNITLVPYGKATTTEEDGRYVFSCQHGEAECYANKVHACATDALDNSTLAVRLATCMILDNNDADAALHRCSNEVKVETEEILKCASGDRGSQLLKKHGDDTHSIDITFIPTITLNESLDNQPLLLKNFLLVVCRQIDMPLPPPCL